jgi:hypothetical protein
VARGGRRQGTAGKAYSNRTDLNGGPKVARIPGQPYGAQAEQVRSQQALPVQAPPIPPPNVDPSMTPGVRSERSHRPNEPLTAGLPSGAGPGPEAFDALPPATPQPGLEELTAIYRVFPYPGIRQLLDAARRRR